MQWFKGATTTLPRLPPPLVQSDTRRAAHVSHFLSHQFHKIQADNIHRFCWFSQAAVPTYPFQHVHSACTLTHKISRNKSFGPNVTIFVSLITIKKRFDTHICALAESFRGSTYEHQTYSDSSNELFTFTSCCGDTLPLPIITLH